MKRPEQIEILNWAKDKVTKWFLERVAFYLNEIDTVRNVEKGDELLARKMAIEVVENALADVFEAGELAKYQKKIAKEEDNVVKSLKQVDEY